MGGGLVSATTPRKSGQPGAWARRRRLSRSISPAPQFPAPKKAAPPLRSRKWAHTHTHPESVSSAVPGKVEMQPRKCVKTARSPLWLADGNGVGGWGGHPPLHASLRFGTHTGFPSNLPAAPGLGRPQQAQGEGHTPQASDPHAQECGCAGGGHMKATRTSPQGSAISQRAGGRGASWGGGIQQGRLVLGAPEPSIPPAPRGGPWTAAEAGPKDARGGQPGTRRDAPAPRPATVPRGHQAAPPAGAGPGATCGGQPDPARQSRLTWRRRRRRLSPQPGSAAAEAERPRGSPCLRPLGG